MISSVELGHHARLGETTSLYSLGNLSSKEILLVRTVRAFVHALTMQEIMSSSNAQ